MEGRWRGGGGDRFEDASPYPFPNVILAPCVYVPRICFQFVQHIWKLDLKSASDALNQELLGDIGQLRNCEWAHTSNCGHLPVPRQSLVRQYRARIGLAIVRRISREMVDRVSPLMVAVNFAIREQLCPQLIALDRRAVVNVPKSQRSCLGARGCVQLKGVLSLPI